MILWRVTLVVAAVCLGCAQADLMSRLIIPRDYGVKLCGREFIRAVIFTCGGSRWRRSTEEDVDPFRRGSLNDATAEDSRSSWHHGAALADRPPSLGSPHSLADLLVLYGRRPALTEASQLSGASGEQAAADEPVADKKKRNFSLGVAGKCCNQGCTKNDIGRLC